MSVIEQDKSKDRGGTLLRYELVRDINRCFESVAVWTNDNLNLTGSGEPLQVPVARVSPSFFSMLGVQPQLGRLFTEDEGRPEGKPVVVLSDAMWRSRFNGDPNIIGRTVTLDATPSTVVGVLPGNIQFPFVGPADIWTPRYFEFSLMTPERLRSGVGYLQMAARLRPGITLAQANAELAVLNQRYREQNPTAPDADPSIVMSAQSLRNLVVANARGKVLVLSAAVAVVLLIACANVASLLLSRAARAKKGNCGAYGARRQPRQTGCATSHREHAARALGGRARGGLELGRYASFGYMGSKPDSARNSDRCRSPRAVVHTNRFDCRWNHVWNRACAPAGPD